MRLKVIKEYKSAYPNPIKLKKGDMVRLGVLDSENPGWIRTYTQDGNEGWAPVEYIEVVGDDSAGTAKCSYTANELNISPGEILEGIKELSGWYWCKNEEGSYGWVPRESVEIA